MGRAFEYRRASKEKRWDKMSRMFPKLGKSITMAAKEGGPDP
ncbi:MAG: YebC/PmpR family DNA-binding transcriptional regulator, partial [Verrucomicrobiales bacterium]